MSTTTFTPSAADSRDAAHPAEFLNRELTWLAFNWRVLHEAIDPRTPLLERVRFLGIFTSNLDEFFMKRVGGLKRQVVAGISPLSIDGLTPVEQLTAIRESVQLMLAAQGRCYINEIRPALAEHDIDLLDWHELSDVEREFADKHFRENVYPILTPMAVDPGHPFPLLSNLSVSLGVKLMAPDSDEVLFARVKVPETMPSWVRLEPEGQPKSYRFVRLYDLISHNIDTLFPGMSIKSITAFRITRNADIDRDEEDAEDLLELIEQELRERRFAPIVRIEHLPDADPWTLQFIMRELELTESDVYEMPVELDYTDLGVVANLEIPKLQYTPWTPTIPPRLADDEADIFAVIRTRDLLVHHPYESFSDSTERLIHTAADDPRTLAIKLTLYRVGDSRTLVGALIRAAEAGKQVICMVELKARFDEQRNILWARQLEQAGVHVFYGLVGLKTHTKLAMVVRQDVDQIRSYVHIGTGNYNVQTARLYTDLGLLTCDPELTQEVVELFHYLTGRSLKSDYEHLLVAPVNMRARFMASIQQEIAHHQAGRPAEIIAKMNSLEDRRIIRELYRASQLGVPIHMMVRGFCCLRPGVPGLSETIRVSSVIGRFLEHSRIFYFRNGAAEPADGEFFIGSADWMYRNLNRRVEVITPVKDSICRQRLWQILHVAQSDERQAWDMDGNGHYVQRQPSSNDAMAGSHVTLMQLAREAAIVDTQGDLGEDEPFN